VELRVPMVVCRRGAGLFEAYVPRISRGVRRGRSLSALRDALAREVIDACASVDPPERMAELSIAPHHELKNVEFDSVFLDPASRRRLPLKGVVPVILEKWPTDDFLLVTPTRDPSARIAIARVDDLWGALIERFGALCFARGVDSLARWEAPAKERLEVLEVQVDGRSPLPRARAAPEAMTPDRPAPERAAAARVRARLFARTLREVARDWTHVAADGGLAPAFGHDAVTEALIDASDGARAIAIALVGPSGAGKTAVLREAVRRLWARVAQGGERMGVWRMEADRFVAGMSIVGQWEARARELTRELRETRDWLCVDDLAALARAGRTSKGTSNLARFLAGPIARGEVSIVGECTPDAFERLRQDEPGFARLFRVIRVEPMSERASAQVVVAAARAHGAGAGGEDPASARAIGLDALESVVSCASRFFANEALPGSAVRLLQDVLDDEQVRSAEPSQRVSAREVRAVVGRKTGLPGFVLGLEPPRAREDIQRELRARVAGQDEAIDAVTDAVLAMQAGLSDPDKPVANLLFVGPTGVGKTETARALAAYLYGSPERLLRFDMSEFQSRASVSRLVGTPWSPDGELTAALRAQPFRVVLFDEVEKADPAVFDALLRMLGEGRITDGAGRPSDARGCVVVMTSNLGVREAGARPGFLRERPAEARAHYVRAAEQFFRPEFFNRIDRVVAFRSLDRPALETVLRNALSDILSRRGVRAHNALVWTEPALLDLLLEQAFDPRYGARPLRRALERRLAIPLAYHLIARRGEGALALIHALERDGEIALAVRALQAPERIAVEDISLWGEAETRAAFDALCVDFDALCDLPETRALEALRAEGLGALADAAVGIDAVSPEARAAIALLEQRDAMGDAIRALDAESAEHFDEREIPGEGARILWRRPRSQQFSRTTFVEVPVSLPARAWLARVRAPIAALRDELAVLSLLVRAASRGIDRRTVLIEPVLASTYPDDLSSVADAIPTFGARVTRLREGADLRWLPVDPARDVSPPVSARLALTLEGPGLDAMLRAYDGYALLTGPAPEDPTRLVRMRVLEGPIESVVSVAAARAREERDALRADPDRAGLLTPGALILRSEGGRLVHIATGLAAHAREAVVAALLKSAEGR
jgi:ATP-dependent Clp protease ATP-binding subunit ClpC